MTGSMTGPMAGYPPAPEPLPRRRPGTHLASELKAVAYGAQPGPGRPGAAWPVRAAYTPPSPDVLLRLLDGLRNLT